MVVGYVKAQESKKKEKQNKQDERNQPTYLYNIDRSYHRI